MDIIEQEIQELNADGVDFVSCGACLKDGKFIGEIYESYTKIEPPKMTWLNIILSLFYCAGCIVL